MKVGEIVMIYEDPITRQKPEGKAVLLRKIADMGDSLERWAVRFEGDGADSIYERNIRVEPKPEPSPCHHPYMS